MPSSSPLDQTNYQTLISTIASPWHTGSGTITYSFLSSVPSYYGGQPDFEAPIGASVSLSSTQRALVDMAMAMFNEIADVNIVKASSGGDIQVGAYDFSDANLFGFAYFPGSGDVDGDLWLNNSMPIVASPSLGDEGWVTIIHELGHALGLKHPFDTDGPTLATSLDTNQYTIMSYDPHPSSSQVWPLTPMLYDIQALQSLYGANTSTRAGDTTYFGSKAGSVYALADNDSMIVTIWDGGGKDLIDATNQSLAVTIDLGQGHFSSIGGLANNVAIAFGVTIENANGGRGNDKLIGNEVGNTLIGGAGNDTIDGGAGIDTAAYVTATAGVRVSLMQTSPQSTVGAGSDSLIRIENLTGSAYADTLTGNGLANLLHGSGGNDTIAGGLGNDTLHGGAGNDRIEGGDGNDRLIGSAGLDVLIGGLGNDVFVLESAPGAGNVDTITDFSAVADTIHLSRAVFVQAGPAGLLQAGAFRAGAAAGDATDRIIYQSSTGAVFYDADGTGGMAQVKIATLSSGLTLTNADFVLV